MYQLVKTTQAHLKKMSAGSGKEMVLAAEQTSALQSRGVNVTDQAAKYVWDEDITSVVKACFLGRNETEDNTGFSDTMGCANGATGLITEKTNFYAEQGGQIYDTGKITSADGTSEFRVDNVQVYGGFVLHLGEVVKGSFCPGANVTLAVDYTRRLPAASNHTFTHVLNFALRKVLVGCDYGKEGAATIDQKGSLCDADKARFDFSWNGALSVDQLAQVEKICQEHITNGRPVKTQNAPIAVAKQVQAIRAVFGEKYPDPVRIVSIGHEDIDTILAKPTDALWDEYSIEFCGGTHLTNTSQGEQFIILNEEGIAKGIRRITAVTQEKAREAANKATSFAGRLADAKEMIGAELENEVNKLDQELKQTNMSAVKKADLKVELEALQKQVQAEKKKKAAGKSKVIVDAAMEVMQKAAESGSNRAVVKLEEVVMDGKLAKDVFKQLGKSCPKVAVMIFSVDSGKNCYNAFAGAPKALKDVDCKTWIADAFEGLGGRGGGKKDNAQWTVMGSVDVDAAAGKAKAGI